MGTQFQVVLLQEDEKTLSDQLVSRFGVQFWLFDGVGNTPASKVKGLEVNPGTDSHGTTRYIGWPGMSDKDQPGNYEFINFTPSRRPIIEYSRFEIIQEPYLHPGRFYAYSYSDAMGSGATFDFGNFEKWKNQVFRFAKQALIKRMQGRFACYFGQQALAKFQDKVDQSLLR